ncbi:MAG: addiction module protein [Sphingobacteriales bacterium]
MVGAKINIQVNFQQIMDAVKQLSPKEKLQLNELIWEDDVDIPIETQKVVLNRIKYAREHPETMLDWDEASKKLMP